MTVNVVAQLSISVSLLSADQEESYFQARSPGWLLQHHLNLKEKKKTVNLSLTFNCNADGGFFLPNLCHGQWDTFSRREDTAQRNR